MAAGLLNPPMAPLNARPAGLSDEGSSRTRLALVLATLLGVCAGLIARGLGVDDLAAWSWTLPTLVVLAALLIQIVAHLSRGDVGLDLIALLSMGGALALSQPLAGAVIALMYTGGQALEAYAAGRAGRQMTALLSRQPRTALRQEKDGLKDVRIEALVPGDRILVRVGDVVPVDGVVCAGHAVLDQATLTGEALPVTLAQGAALLSGSVNVGPPFTMLADRPAADSTYAGIVRLVESARAQKAPMSRMADRFGLVFLGLTLLTAGAAWAWTGEPLRALAVMVVATPCPLILAVPIALVSGLSRAAGIGVLIKGAGALEALPQIRTLVIDKTGTLTHGVGRLVAADVLPPFKEASVLRMAASLDQASTHPTARTLVQEARLRGLTLTQPLDVTETAGEGISGRVEGCVILVGAPRFVQRQGVAFPASGPGAVAAFRVRVAIDGRPAATLCLKDPLRDGIDLVLGDLRSSGIQRIVVATGDRRDVADEITAGLTIERTASDLSPADKVAVVRTERARGPVMMVGDGVNDAPALATADLGVALGAKGAAAAAEAADIVLLHDGLDALPQAMRIAVRARAIALQSVAVGLGLSLGGMGAAAAGLLSPLQGALLQEAIDVAVILNALRVLR